MSYSIEIENDIKCIVYKHSGMIQKEEMAKVWENLLIMKEFTEFKYNLLADMRGGFFNFASDELNDINDFLKSVKNILIDKKMAVIVDNPSNSVISMLYEYKNSEEIGLSTKTFSTETAALQWLLD
jgi:hypothetical protein